MSNCWSPCATGIRKSRYWLSRVIYRRSAGYQFDGFLEKPVNLEELKVKEEGILATRSLSE